MSKLKHIVYQITNLINDKIYIGIHSTYVLDDGYMGSGTRIKRAIDKHGFENFKRDILFEYETIEEASQKESEIIDKDFIARKDVYNIKLGGFGWKSTDTIPVRDLEGNYFRVHKTDERWLSGELKHNNAGTTRVMDMSGNIYRVSDLDPKYLSGELIRVITVQDVEGKRYTVKIDDSRLQTGDLFGFAKNTVIVEDSTGFRFRVSKNDPRYISGELTVFRSVEKHTNETKEIISQKGTDQQRTPEFIENLIKHLTGRPVSDLVRENMRNLNLGKPCSEKTKEAVRNANKGNTYRKGVILTDETKQKIRDFNLGRIIVTNLELQKNKQITLEELTSYQELGWKRGRTLFNK